jgi:hypothetical protein
VTSLDKIQTQLDELAVAQGVLLSAIHELNVELANVRVMVANVFTQGGANREGIRLIIDQTSGLGTRLAAIMGKLCTQQEARRGKAAKRGR